MEFKIGDRVRATDKAQKMKARGQEGTIIQLVRGSKQYTVEFDNHIDGHSGNLGVRGKTGHVWHMECTHVELIPKLPTLKDFIGDKFKGKRANVIQNGNTYKLVKSDGTVLYTYIPEKELKRIVETRSATERAYIELFEQAIKEFNDSKE